MVTVGRRAYDLMYRFRAPWELADRVELRALVQDGRCAPDTLRRPDQPVARAIDLGCGAGGVSIELAEAGFEVTGVDFSPVALRKAARAAGERRISRDRLRLMRGDLTTGRIEGVDGPFDLLVDYGTLDDLPATGRQAMAEYIARLARPGARFFLYAFAGRPEDLPRLSFSGPSRAFPGIDDHEVDALFGHAFRIEVLDPPTRTRHLGTWLLERTDGGAPPVHAVRAARGSRAQGAVRTESQSAVAGERAAGYALMASAAVAAVGIVFLVAMFAAFAMGARDPGLAFGFVNDTLVLVSYLLALPTVMVLHARLRPDWHRWSTLAAAAGIVGIAGVVVFQGLLVAGVMTFEQQIGPALVFFLVLGAWFVATGHMASRAGVLPRGGRLGVLAVIYFGYPLWAVALARRLLAPSRAGATRRRAFA